MDVSSETGTAVQTYMCRYQIH